MIEHVGELRTRLVAQDIWMRMEEVEHGSLRLIIDENGSVTYTVNGAKKKEATLSDGLKL